VGSYRGELISESQCILEIGILNPARMTERAGKFRYNNGALAYSRTAGYWLRKKLIYLSNIAEYLPRRYSVNTMFAIAYSTDRCLDYFLFEEENIFFFKP